MAKIILVYREINDNNQLLGIKFTLLKKPHV